MAFPVESSIWSIILTSPALLSSVTRCCTVVYGILVSCAIWVMYLAPLNMRDSISHVCLLPRTRICALVVFMFFMYKSVH